jgi:hypothetical protein
LRRCPLLGGEIWNEKLISIPPIVAHRFHLDEQSSGPLVGGELDEIVGRIFSLFASFNVKVGNAEGFPSEVTTGLAMFA